MMGRKRRSYAVPNVEQHMKSFKAEVMKKEGYAVDAERPDDVKYEVAKEIGVPLSTGHNGELTTEEAGHIGGKIGGSMVKELIRIAQEKLVEEQQRTE